jgi:glycerophosphoryl diester phosphodiesterase
MLSRLPAHRSELPECLGRVRGLHQQRPSELFTDVPVGVHVIFADARAPPATVTPVSALIMPSRTARQLRSADRLPTRALVPAVVAHRGSSAQLPEHTLAAYETAIADGADGLEADVRLTRDGHLVCVHDRTVDRTSNGSGAVSDLTLAALSTLDFGSWHARDDAVRQQELLGGPTARRVLTLERLLELVCSAPRPVSLAVETKHPTRWSGLVERELAHQLARFGLLRGRDGQLSQVRVMSFSSAALRRARALMPALALVQLTARPLLVAPSGTSVWGPSIDVVRRRPELVGQAQARGRAVHVWTVDRPADLELCRDLGVDAVITNRPAFAVETLAVPVAA